MRKILWIASGDIDITTLDLGEERSGFIQGNVPDGLPPWLTQGDLDAYAQAFIRSGYTGGLNWYRKPPPKLGTHQTMATHQSPSQHYS